MTQEQFKHIFNAHFEGIRNYIYYRSGDTELATDVTQEAFLRLWEKRNKIKDENIRGLLYKIAGDIFISNYRKQQSAMNFKLEQNTGANFETPQDRLQFEELSRIYDMALRELPEKQRVVFLMSRIDELKYHEIAENIGISVKAVEKRMKHALEFMKNALKYQ